MSSSPHPDAGQVVSARLWKWLAPFIFIFGLMGNILILVLLRVRRRRSTGSGTNIFVQLIAVADICVLVFAMLPEWLKASDIFNVREATPTSCKFHKFFLYTSTDIAIWFITAFTIERFISVCMPMRKKHFCRIGHIKIYCIGIILLAAVKNLHTFFTRGQEWVVVNNSTLETIVSEFHVWKTYNSSYNSGQAIYTTDHDVTTYSTPHTENMKEQDEEYHLISNCGYTSPANAHFHYFIRPWIVFAVSNLVPLITMIVCNTSVTLTLYRRRHARHLGGSSANRGDDSMNQVTIMCIVVSIAFVLFYLPSMILLVGKPYWQESPYHRKGYVVAKAVNNQLLFINHSINFYLYLATCRSFRRQALRTLCCCCYDQETDDGLSQRRPSNASYRRNQIETEENKVKLLRYSPSSP